MMLELGSVDWLDVLAVVIACHGVVFALWGLIDSTLDRRAVFASGMNGLRREAAMERLISSWLVLTGQVILAACIVLLMVRHATDAGHVVLAALTLVCGVFTLKTIAQRRARTRMLALYAAGHR